MPTSQVLDIYRCPLEGTTLIEASAGTGKTWAICGLVLRLLVEKELTIDQVLVVTFTNAATAELRSRVRLRLLEVLTWLENEDQDQAETGDPFVPQYIRFLEQEQNIPRANVRTRIRAALASFDEASIFTIHSFCQRALGENPFASGQAFNLELGDSRDLIQEVVADFWRIHIAHGTLSPTFINWLIHQGLTPEQLLKLLEQALKTPLAITLWPEHLDQLAEPDDSTLEKTYQEATRCWKSSREKIATCLHHKLADLKYLKAEDIDTGSREWDTYFSANAPLQSIGEKALNFRQSVLTDKKTKAGKTPPTHAFFNYAEALCSTRNQLENQLQDHRLLLFKNFLDWAPHAVTKLKQTRHRVDFNDLLANLHRVLTGPKGPDLAANLRQRYPAALIDEFQDTDPLQFAIFDNLYGEGNSPVFLVGDPKQAIYSFRQADLHTYLAARKKAHTHYHLDANQRSSEGVIAGINTLFSTNPRAFMLEGLDFLPTHRGAKPLEDFQDTSAINSAPFHLWQLSSHEEEMLSRAEAFERSALACAEEIARLLYASAQGEIRLGNASLHPGRIAILVRTHKQGRLMKIALAQVGLKAAELAQANVFHTPEAEDLERLLLALQEPGHGGLLRGALATPMLGLNASEILKLQQNDKDLEHWISLFSLTQRNWQNQGIAPCLGMLGETQGIPARLLALQDGERRLTNHLHLIELLHQAERNFPQPARLLQWFCQQRQKPDADETAQLRLESDQDLINIVTIHKAKGLEYDIVFCPFLWEGGIYPNNRGLPGNVYHDANGQLVLDYRGSDEGKSTARLEHAAELLRLYYVALTRPVHRCYLICGPYGKNTASGKFSVTESSKSMLNWLMAGSGMAPEQWLSAEGKTLPSLEDITNLWQQLAHKLCTTLQPLPEPGHFKLPPSTEEPHYQAQKTRRTLYSQWRIDSFTGLIRGIDSHDGSDRDLLTSNKAVTTPPASVAEQDFLLFPRGTEAGNCIHHLFENIDFTQSQTWPQTITSTLNIHFPDTPEQTRPYQAMLTNMLQNVLSTPLPSASETPIYLNQLTNKQKLVEMEFHLPAGQLQSEALTTLLQQHGEDIPPLGFQTLRGYLKGFIDLIFIHEDRYYVLDWKSNHLGWEAQHYKQSALEDTMFEHAYRLQAQLYLLALHRFLAYRLPDYRPEQHLGGAHYLFIRGVRPDWQTEGQQTGICYLPPKPELIQALDHLLTPS